MQFIARLSVLLTILLSAGCPPFPQVTMPLSEPNAALFDSRMAGIWYSGTAGNVLQLAPREDRASFDVVGLSVGLAGPHSVAAVRGVGHASTLDRRTYYNIEFPPFESARYVIVQADMTSDGTLFLHFMDGQLVRGLTSEHRIKAETLHSAALDTDVAVIDTSPDALASLIREIGPDRLFSTVRGPFYRIAGEEAVITPLMSESESDEEESVKFKFGDWEFKCEKPAEGSNPSAEDVSMYCRVIDGGGNIRITFAPNEPNAVTLGTEKCAAGGGEVQVDDTDRAQIGTGAPANTVLIERMLLGRVLHIVPDVCAGSAAKPVDVSLAGFPAAYNLARATLVRIPVR